MAKDGKIILKRTNAALYYKAPNTWVESTDDAFDFQNIVTAHEFCVGNKLTGVVVILGFENPSYDVMLNVY